MLFRLALDPSYSMLVILVHLGPFMYVDLFLCCYIFLFLCFILNPESKVSSFEHWNTLKPEVPFSEIHSLIHYLPRTGIGLLFYESSIDVGHFGPTFTSSVDAVCPLDSGLGMGMMKMMDRF